MRARKPKRRIIQILIFATAVTLLAGLLTSLDRKDMTVDAASLKHIDEIVADSGTFNILEIVPETAGASIGYYADGQEPVSGWQGELAALTSAAERSAYVNNLFGRLADRGVLSGAETTPLMYTYYDTQNNSYYTEAYEVSDAENWSMLELAVPESVTMTGTLSEAEDGEYQAVYDYTQAENGGYIQNIHYFSYTDTPDYTGSVYYYEPVFTGITEETDLTVILDAVVYTYDEQTLVYTAATGGEENELLTVQAVIDQGGFDITDPEQVEYYYADPAQLGAPGEYGYEAVAAADDDDDAPGDGFTDVTDGTSYFTREITSYTYVGSGGSYTYSSDGSDEWTVIYESIYYKAGFSNNNLIKKQVFGLEGSSLSELNITVTTRSAAEVTSSDVTAADLIYLSTGSDITQSGVTTVYTDTSDIADGAAAAIYSFAADSYPVIVDYAIIDNISQWTQPDQINNIEKLCLLALQSSLAETDETSLAAMDYDWDLLYYVSNDIDRTFVNNNVYCFNAFNTQSTADAANISALVTSLFNETFSSEVYSSGFSDVLEEIENENLLREVAGEEEMLDEAVTISASVRHIINYKGRRESNPKLSITVLDLEPAKVTASTWLTAEDVRGWIDETLDEDQITVVHMTTGEFIGKIEDINETYDMIYIGMSTESLNTISGTTVYNDPYMKELIYTNIGDTVYATIEMAGIREQDYVWYEGVKAIDYTDGSNANLFRFSGNDITATKVTELKQYAQAGYPIILADGFVSGADIDTSHVDSSSYMYKAVSDIYGDYGNVMSQSYAEDHTDALIEYLNLSKPTLVLAEDTGVPAADYEADSSATLAVDADGYYYLDYTFSISNITDATPIATTYDCLLYIDLNADGRYASSEELGDIVVHRVADNALILPLTEDGSETYALSADVQYRVTRQMPTDYVGIIPWKLEVVKNGADQIHASAEGYTRIAAGTNKETISVLHIMEAGTYNSKLNLQQQMENGGIYGDLIKDLEDFDVSIEAIENDDLEDSYGSSENIFDKLNEYDMLIIGFNDCYDGIGENTAEAIVNYIDTGKSVLFTHDTTSLSQVPYTDYPMLTEGEAPDSIMLDDTDILYNSVTSEYESIDGNIYWYGDEATTPPSLEQDDPTYIVFLSQPVDSADENDYFNERAGSSGDYEIYEINDINNYNNVWKCQENNVYSNTSLADFRSSHRNASIVYVYCGSGNLDGWYRNNSNYFVSATCDFTKFVDGTRYYCNDLTFEISRGYGWYARSLTSTDYDWIAFCLASDSYPENYEVVGTYDGTYYRINGTKYYGASGSSFPQRVLYDSDPSVSAALDVLPRVEIPDYWGYYFNTVIRDAVGLDRYGVTSTLKALEDGTLLKDIVNTETSLSWDMIDAVLACQRSVAYTPKSSGGTTVDEYQGYSNYALIRFADGSANTYSYTNNNYAHRTTTNISQVNKGQITTYPYNVNTEDFSATTNYIGTGGSYMTIGETHEQYFQINMNTDDIVVWYCLSSGGSDNSSYYDDVPNDCVNAYYIYNKGNVTYSGVGHLSDAGLYGSGASQQYVNEAKLFVNTMIAAYRAGEQSPTVSIKQDERGTADMTDKYIVVDDSTENGETEVLQTQDGMEEERVVYYRVSDPNIAVSKTITAAYYIADENGETVDGIGEPVTLLVDTEGNSLTTYYVNGTVAGALKGGYMYKFYLPEEGCLDLLADADTYSVRVYVKITSTFGNSVFTASDSVELKKQQLFQLT